MRIHKIKGTKIIIDDRDGVFKPTRFSELMASSVNIKKGDRVLDLGCGTGIIGIYAAKLGAHVTCADIMQSAIDRTMLNAELNDVQVTTIKSDCFENITGSYDIIIDDMSALPENVARTSPWYPHPIPSGGKSGIENTVKFLTTVSNFLNTGAKFYFPILSISDFKPLMSMIGGLAECVSEEWYPVTDNSHLTHGYTEKRGSRHFWCASVYKGTKNIFRKGLCGGDAVVKKMPKKS